MPTPIGHMVSGVVIASISRSKSNSLTMKKRLLLGAFVAASPDLDLFLTFLGVDYFYAHRTFSHSLVTVSMVFLFLLVLQKKISVKKDDFTIPYILITTCLFSHIYTSFETQECKL